MFRRQRLLNILIVILAVLVLAGCPLQIKKQSNADLYYTALGYWQSTLNNFRIVYREATPEARKGMVDTMKKLSLIKKTVLNPWETALATGDQAGISSSNAAWKTAKNTIILEVINTYFPEKGGL